MRLAADTNWLAATYFEHERSATVERFQRKHGVPLFVSPPVLLECRNVFCRIARTRRPPEWTRLESDLGARLQRLPLSWEEIHAAAEVLIDRFAAKTALGTFDLAIVAAAHAGQATHFLSFDSDSSARALAAALRLEVVPPLNATDKDKLAALLKA